MQKSYGCTKCQESHFGNQAVYTGHLKYQSKHGISDEFEKPDSEQLTADTYKGFTLPEFLVRCYNVGQAMMRYLTEHAVKFTIKARTGEDVFIYIQNDDEGKRVYQDKRIFFITSADDHDNKRPMMDTENENDAYNFARLIFGELVK